MPYQGPNHLHHGDGSFISHIVNWVVQAMDTLGAFGAGVMMALETIFPFIPSEVILPLAGFTISKGQMSFWLVLFWTTLGAMSTAWIYWGLGALLGRERTRRIMAKLPLVEEKDIIRTENWFDKHGEIAVFFARMVPVFRGFISLPAGVTRMPFWKFTILSIAGSVIWNVILIGAGYWLGEKWELAEKYVGLISIGILVVVVIALMWWLARRFIWRKRAKNSAVQGRADVNTVDAGDDTGTDLNANADTIK